MIKVAIIGSAGRNKYEYNILSVKHLEYMVTKVEDFIKNTLNTTNNNIILVSGGSAWSDHVAVQLYLSSDFGGLELYLPARFDLNLNKFENTNEGNRLNSLHEQFEKKTKCSIFNELYLSITDPNIKVVIEKGFLQRNTMIAKNNDYLIAFTFSTNDLPTNGSGTFDTWHKTKHNNKIHFDLNEVTT